MTPPTSGRRTGRTGTSASCGPAAASGWYCTENARPSTSLMPSTTPSLAQVWLTSAVPNGVSNRSPASPSSAKPWFCAVTATRPVAWSMTGHVDAAVPEHHLVGRPAQRAAEDLVAEADAEQRDPGAEHLAGDADDVVGGRRVARPVGQEHPVGLELGDLVEGRRRRQHVAADAAAGRSCAACWS